MANHEPMSAEDHTKLQEMLTEFYDAIARKNKTLAAGIAYDIVGQQVIELLLAENAAMRPIVQAVAKDDWGECELADGTVYEIGCPFCIDPTPVHRAGCEVLAAQAFVKAHPAVVRASGETAQEG